MSSSLYGHRPVSASTASAPPRFEFGSTVIRRPSHAVSLQLRTQPLSYPHQPETKSHRPTAPSSARAPPAHAAPFVSPRSSRPSSAYSARARVATRPVTTDDVEFTDRYLPRPHSAAPDLSTLPTSWTTHVYVPTPDEDVTQSQASLLAHDLAARVASRPQPQSHPIPAAPFRPSLNHTYAHVGSRIRHPEMPRGFMSTPAYFGLMAAQEARDEAERLEAEAREKESMRGRRARHASAPAGGTFVPTIPLPARYAGHTATAAPTSSQPATAASLSTVRLSTALGLHERSLDALQVLSQLKHALDTNFEIVRIEERERRAREENERQQHVKEERARKNALEQAASVPQLQYIQAGNLSIPNGPNVTSTTLALLMAAPSHSAPGSTSRLHAAITPTPPSSVPAPTFLTDAEIESHAMSNFSASEQRKLFGGSYSARTREKQDDREEQKELPFDRTRFDDPIEDPPAKKKPPRVGARREPPTTALPDHIEFTPAMMEAFEESVRNWGIFLLESNGTGVNGDEDPNADLLLVLHDVSAKYSSLMRMAMNPEQPDMHVLLPRMMEAVYKIMMVVLETALVRKAAAAPIIPEAHTTSTVASKTNQLVALEQTNADATDHEDPAVAQQSSMHLLTIQEDAPPPVPARRVTTVAAPSVASGSTSIVPPRPSSFDPGNPEHLALFYSTLSRYDELPDAAAISTTTRTATKDVLSAFSVRAHESQLKDTGLYSVGLLLQRDSLLKSSEQLLRENEYLKMHLRDAHSQINWLQENEQRQIRALAQTGEDTVGIALDELDEYMDDCVDAHRLQIDTVAKVSDMAYEWTNRHASAVTAEVTADSSHKESCDTIRRLNAKEAELVAVRQTELDNRLAEAAVVATDKAKAFAVLDREVQSMETLTDEQIVAKIGAVTDVDTLRGMIHKLLFTKIKRHVNESPSQRAARLRKENTPKLLKAVLLRTSKQSDRLMALKPLCRTILEIYFSKVIAGDLDMMEVRDAAGSITNEMVHKRRGATLHGFAYEFFLQKFGLKNMAEAALAELLRSVMVFLQPDKAAHAKYASFVAMNSEAILDKNARPRLAFFARLLHLFTDHAIVGEGMEFFLYALKVLHESCVQSIPAGFNTSHPKDAGMEAKAMVRTLEVACVSINMNAPQSARALGKRNSQMDSATQAMARAISGADDPESVGSLSLYVPLFLAVESMAHAFRHLGYDDSVMDTALCQIERQYIYPANLVSAGTDQSRMKILLKQIIVRQMMRTAGIGTSLAFDKFDTNPRSGVVNFTKLRALIDMDRDTASALCTMMDPEIGYLGPLGGVIASDFAQAVSPDYRLCVSLDTLMELSTSAWLSDHQATTDRYRACFARHDASGHSLLTFVEFYMLLIELDPLKTRPVAVKLFKEGREAQARIAAANFAAEETLQSKRKKGSRKKSHPIPPKPPLIGIAAPPPPAELVVVVAPTEEEAKVDPEATPQVAETTSEVPDVPLSPASQRRQVKFAATAEAQAAAAADNTASSAAKPPLPPTIPHEFLNLDTVLGLLRRHRVGLAPRKPFQEFRAFLRRHRASAGGGIARELPTSSADTVADPILESEAITSIPEDSTDLE